MTELYTRETLIQRLSLSYDENAWTEFTHIYQQYIYNICRRMNLSHHDTEEVVQKVLLRLWKKIPTFTYDKNKTFRGLVRVITTNLVKDFYINTSSRKVRQDKAENHQEWLNKDFSEPQMEKIADEEWKSYLANLALKNISSKFSEKVIDVFKDLMKGHSSSELAERYGLEHNTINVYKKRVMQKLHEEIRHLDKELS